MSQRAGGGGMPAQTPRTNGFVRSMVNRVCFGLARLIGRLKWTAEVSIAACLALQGQDIAQVEHIAGRRSKRPGKAACCI